jgi:hypothetical protein
MPRVCNREGCGKQIVGKDGRSDYRKHFCSIPCLNNDKRERLQAKRLRLEGRRCSHCGRKPISVGDKTEISGGCDGDPNSDSVTENSEPIVGAKPSLVTARHSERAEA